MILNENYLALIFFFMGITASQYLVTRLAHNHLRLQDIHRTITVTTATLQSGLGLDTTTCLVRINEQVLHKALMKNQTNLIIFLVLSNILWMFMIILLFHPLNVTSALGISISYVFSFCLIGFLNYYIVVVYDSNKDVNYLYTDFFYPSLL